MSIEAEEVEETPLPAKLVQIAVPSNLSKSGSLLMLIQAYLYKRSVHTGMQIDSDIYGVIEVIYSEPLGSSIITTQTVVSFYESPIRSDLTFVESLSSCNGESAPTTELIGMLTAHLLGVEVSVRTACELMMNKVRRVMESNGTEPSAVSSGVLIHGYSGSGKTTILQTSETFFRSKGVSVSYLNCSVLLSERKRGESVAAIEAAMFPTETETSAASSLHIVLIDNIDVAFERLSDSMTTFALTSALLNAIDSLRMQTDRKGFIVATCTDLSNVPESLFRLARFGEPTKIYYPSMQSRTAVASKALFALSPSVLNQLLSLIETSSLKNSLNEEEPNSSELCAILATEISRRTQGYSVLDLISSIKMSIGDDLFQSLQGELKVTSIDSFLDRITSSKSSTALASTTSVYIKDFSSARPPPVPAGFQHIVEKILRRTVHTTNQAEDRSEESAVRHMMGIKPCKGVIIYGPHGSGKTCLANRVAYESRSSFKFVSLSCAELVHKVVGESEKRLAELFRMARSISPCFILLDNIEVILGTPAATTDASRGAPVSMGKRHRTRTTHKAIDRILSTLLMEIDGIEDPAERKDHMEDSHGEGGGGGRGQVIVIATMSNHPKHLDSALIRPGRLEEHIGLELPTLSQRRDIVRSLLQQEESTLRTTEEDDVINLLAESTDGSSPAEIIQVVQEASMDTIRNCIRQQRKKEDHEQAPGSATTMHSPDTPLFSSPVASSSGDGMGAHAVDLNSLHSSRKQHIVERLNTLRDKSPKPFDFS